MDFYIVPFDKLKYIEERIKKKHFNFVIIDECHFITSLTMKRYYTLISIAQQSKRLLLLSSTPIEQGPLTIFPMLNCIRPDIFNSFTLSQSFKQKRRFGFLASFIGSYPAFVKQPFPITTLSNAFNPIKSNCSVFVKQ